MSKTKCLLIVVFLVTMVVSSFGCASNSTSTSASIDASTTVKTEEPVVIKFMLPNVGDIKTPGFQSDPISAEIEKLLNIKLEILDGDPDKRAVMLAANELPDIFIDNASTKSEQYIKSGLVINFDDYKDKLPSLQQPIMKDALNYWRDVAGGADKKLYFLPTQTGGPEPCDVTAIKPGLTLFFRWDYYASLGYPEVNNLDEFLPVLKAMQDKYPKTTDGKKTYALGAWTDWGLWPYYIPFKSKEDSALPWGGAHMYGNPDSRLWLGIEFFNKAWNMGLVDPESFIMKMDAYQQALNSGKYFVTEGEWFANDANAALAAQPGFDAKNPQGFAYLPTMWPTTSVRLASSQNGWSDCMLVPKNTKNLDKVLEFINFAYSYEGCRLMVSGIKGKDWDIVNGKAKLTAKAIANMADVNANTGIDGKYGRLCGLNYYAKTPSDGGYIRLSYDKELSYAKLSPVEKVFSEHFGVKMPSEYDEKLVAEGKLFFDPIAPQAPYINWVLPDEVSKVTTLADTEVMKMLPQLIKAKSNKEFQKLKSDTITKLLGMGLDKAIEFEQKRWDDATAKANAAK